MIWRLFFAWIVVLGVVHGANLYVLLQSLFRSSSWIDIPLHFFGGVGVGFLALWLLVWTGRIPIAGHTTRFAERMRRAFPEGVPWWFSLEKTILISGWFILGWELMEVGLFYYIDLPLPYGYLADTTLDITLGFLGAFTAWATFCIVQLQHAEGP
jgi:hypothetical protein